MVTFRVHLKKARKRNHPRLRFDFEKLKCLTVEQEILSRWTEYCSELYNYKTCEDNAVLYYTQPPKQDLQWIPRTEVEIAVASLKKGKSARVDNIPAELVQAGGRS